MGFSRELFMQKNVSTSSESLQKRIQSLSDDHRDKPGALLSILEKLQDDDEFRHLSEETLKMVAHVSGEPLSRVWSVATFYSYFNLSPQGKHTISVCRGTACHTRGSLGLLREAMCKMGVEDFREDEDAVFTTDDRLFSVRVVACFGQCALAPVVAVDGVIHSRVTTGQLCKLIDGLRKGSKK
jgi:NADH-quinone oxidoreductase subunit E